MLDMMASLRYKGKQDSQPQPIERRNTMELKNIRKAGSFDVKFYTDEPRRFFKVSAACSKVSYDNPFTVAVYDSPCYSFSPRVFTSPILGNALVDAGLSEITFGDVKFIEAHTLDQKRTCCGHRGDLTPKCYPQY